MTLVGCTAITAHVAERPSTAYLERVLADRLTRARGEQEDPRVVQQQLRREGWITAAQLADLEAQLEREGRYLDPNSYATRLVGGMPLYLVHSPGDAA